MASRTSLCCARSLQYERFFFDAPPCFTFVSKTAAQFSTAGAALATTAASGWKSALAATELGPSSGQPTSSCRLVIACSTRATKGLAMVSGT